MATARPLPDDTLIELAHARFRMADRDGATDDDQMALRDLVPALIYRLKEKVDHDRRSANEPVLDLRFCGIELPDDEQIELDLPRPE